MKQLVRDYVRELRQNTRQMRKNINRPSPTLPSSKKRWRGGGLMQQIMRNYLLSCP